MRLGKLYGFLVKFCSLFGALGVKIQNWAEYREWRYWNDRRTKIIDLPEDIHVHLDYNNKGDYVKVAVLYWPIVDGKYDWRREPVMREKFTREQIHLLATTQEGS